MGPRGTAAGPPNSSTTQRAQGPARRKALGELEANPQLSCLWRPPLGARAPKTEFLRLNQRKHTTHALQRTTGSPRMPLPQLLCRPPPNAAYTERHGLQMQYPRYCNTHLCFFRAICNLVLRQAELNRGVVMLTACCEMGPCWLVAVTLLCYFCITTSSSKDLADFPCFWAVSLSDANEIEICAGNSRYRRNETRMRAHEPVRHGARAPLQYSHRAVRAAS
jgi:hypothetical protein